MPSKTSTSTTRSPSPDSSTAAVEDLFVTRTVEFAFHRQRLQFDLARTVFASAGVDPGSALLLRHLQAVGLDGGERVLDVGAGHGTLGIVLAALDRRRSVTFLDRDALACAFTARNLVRNGLTSPAGGDAGPVVRGSLGYDAVVGDEPFDLVVSNIPGKAGDAVIANLVTGSADVARAGAIVAFVVVKPLETVLERLVVLPRFEPLLLKGNKTHVVAIGRVGPPPATGDPSESGDGSVAAADFERGLYDRTTDRFSSGELRWTATTVTGLDEFDSLAQPTKLLRGALQGVRAGPSVIANPGQGHRAVIAALAGYPPAAIIGRDLLSLAATERCLARNGTGEEPMLVHGLGIPDEWFDRCRVTILHADDKVHGPWFTAEVIRYLDHVDSSSDRSRRDLVLTGRSGLLGRLEADILRRRKGHVAYKRSVKGYRALRYSSGR